MASIGMRASNIAESKVVRLLHVPNVTAFTLQYSKKYAYSASTSQELVDAKLNSPVRTMVERRWNTRSEPLWWTALAPMTLKPERTVRSWCARRIRQAFIESLEKEGYDRAGNQVAGGPPIVGTVQLFARPPLMETKVPELNRQMRLAVQHLIATSGKRAKPSGLQEKKGQHRNGSRKWQVEPRPERTSHDIGTR